MNITRAQRIANIVRWIIWGFIVLAVLVLVFAGSQAMAQEAIPRGLGHPAGNLNHWYEPNCCSLADCEPVEEGAIVETKDGYLVRYLTSRGFIAQGLVPYGAPAIRVSKDHRNHACANGQGKILCIYIVPTA